MANQTRQLAELLTAAGARVELIQTNAPYRPSAVGKIPVLRALFRLLPYVVGLWRGVGRANLVHVMANSGWSWHLFATPAIFIAHWRGVPVLVNYRGGEAGTFLARSHASVRRTMARAGLLAVPSGFLQTVFAAHGIKADIVPNIVDLARFYPATEPHTTQTHLVVVRNLEPIYDNETAIRSLAIVRERWPAARLTIAGTGPEEARLKRLVIELGLQSSVQLVGRLDREAVARLYREADVALNPSTVDNMPNSVLEALASGVPVVSTNVGGVPYIVQDGTTALLVPARDAAAMAAATMRLLDNPRFAQSMAEAGLSEVHNYTWARVADVLAAAYARTLATRR